MDLVTPRSVAGRVVDKSRVGVIMIKANHPAARLVKSSESIRGLMKNDRFMVQW